MCLVDWQLGSVMRTSFTALNVVAAGGSTIPPNPNRVMLSIWGPQSANTMISPIDPLLVGALGTPCTLQTPFRLIMTEVGDMVTKSYFIFNNSGAQINMAVFEGVLPSEYLQVLVDSFRGNVQKLLQAMR